jgi:hypothetical protein
MTVLLAHLKEFESKRVLDIEARTAGTYQPGEFHINGNSILSSVHVTAIDPGVTLKVNYYDTSAGSVQSGERFDLTSHDLIDDSITFPYTQRISVTKIHMKPVLEYIITGAGSVTFGVYLTTVSSFATDLDNALVREGDTFVQETSRAIPMACYDEDNGTLHFLRCENGALSVSESFGDRAEFNFDGDSTPGTTQTLIDETLSATKTTKIHAIRLSCRNHGIWEARTGSTVFASGMVSPMKPNDDYVFLTQKVLAPSANLNVRFRAHTPAPASALRVFVQTTQKV